jgi:hypothetical protein
VNVFLSAPLTQILAKGREGVLAFADVWNEVIHELESSGHAVFSAHRREEWGAALNEPAEALVADLEGLRAADLVVAYIGSPPSPGVQLEIGYALALGRPFLIFVDRNQPEPYLLRGMPQVAQVELVEIDALPDILDGLRTRGLIGSVLAGSPPAGKRR